MIYINFMLYKCNICLYETKDKSNLNKHISSRIHLKKSNGALLSTSTTPQKSSENKKLPEFTCQYCQLNFSRLSSLTRHKKICADKNTKIMELEIENKCLKNQIEQFKSLAENNKFGSTTYNISIKNQIIKDHSDAPRLEYIKLLFKYLKDNEQDLIDVLVYQYDNKSLNKYLGNFLIKYYVKKDPNEQSIWNSDINRLTFIVKEQYWDYDYKAVKTKICIIDPLLTKIKKFINKYTIKFIDEIKSDDFIVKESLLNKFNSLAQIRYDINHGTLADRIVKYMAPYFSFDRNYSIDKLNSEIVGFLD